MCRKFVFAGLVALMLLRLSACNATEPVPLPADESSLFEDNVSVEGRQVKVTAGDVEVIITLNDSRAAADFAEMLPLELTLIERNSFAKGMTLPRPLSTEEATTREYEIGDFGYWAAGPDLAIFYDNIYEQTIVPVIPIGKAETGAENMRDTSGSVRLECCRNKKPPNKYAKDVCFQQYEVFDIAAGKRIFLCRRYCGR